MHIGQTILEDIEGALNHRYSIDIAAEKWKLFKEPLRIVDGKIDRLTFEDRQKKSIEIITKILDIHGKTDIVKFLGRLARLEPRIQELQPWVRDHVVHAINTFILGVYILKNVEFPAFEGTRFGYPFMWKMCGPTHDLGYPIEIAHNIRGPFASEVNDILESIKSPSPRVEPESCPKNLDRLCEDRDGNAIIQERLNDWSLGIDIEHYYGWLKERNKTDHGVVSALAQLKVIEALYYNANPNREYRDITRNNLNFNQKNFDLDIVSACSALFIHNIDLSYNGFPNKISFNIAPLGFLLFLCDTFQEWDRYAENRPIYPGNAFNINCRPDSISLVVSEELEERIFAALHQRLTGLMVEVNGRTAVS